MLFSTRPRAAHNPPALSRYCNTDLHKIILHNHFPAITSSTILQTPAQTLLGQEGRTGTNHYSTPLNLHTENATTPLCSSMHIC